MADDMNIAARGPFEGAGEMAALIRTFDWSATALGPVATWPRSLETLVSTVLRNPFPMLLFWGPELVQFYNDAFRPSLGQDGHPRALGASGREFWADIWPVVGPLLEGVLRGDSTWAQDQLIPIKRDGAVQEVFWTFSYSPVPDDAGEIGGVLVTVQETTIQVQGERQLRLLHDLAAASSEAMTAERFCARAAKILATDDADMPFAMVYLLEGEQARLAGSAGFEREEAPGRPALIDLGDEGGVWPLSEAARAGELTVVPDVSERVGEMPRGPWDAECQSAVIVPLAGPAQTEPLGFLVSGASPRRPLDDRYLRLFSLVADQISVGISNARAREQERRRVEALAELDRTKTAFFSNVSHELRTPLTLILAPLEDTLEQAVGRLEPQDRERLTVAHRNAKRLRKLVNTVLDFTRIEAGRVAASYEPLDLASLTCELTSLFESAATRAGLRLVVDCPPLGEHVYVDREMWEKIVFNLLSNALKFTLEGEIRVAVDRDGDDATLTVRDTGVGIPPGELPRLFARFHRVEDVRGRSIEGSGIGLALVRELVGLHGGEISVESELDRGTTFTVRIPVGSAHLPADRIGAARALAATGPEAEAYLDEVLSWTSGRPSSDAGQPAAAAAMPGAPRVLLADDNADVLAYVGDLLRGSYEVETVGDGVTALAAVRARRPDLVLSDVMMPGLDGFGLLRALRADPELEDIPVILLSARAGEEAATEGIAAGAADYLVKPFGARELLGRVSARLSLAHLENRLREQRSQWYRVFEQTPLPTCVVRGPELVCEMANPAAVETLGGRDPVGRPLLEVVPELEGQGFDEMLREVMRSGRPFTGNEVRAVLDRDGTGDLEETYWTFVFAPLREESGDIQRVISIGQDVTDQVRAREVIREGMTRYRHIFEAARVSIWEEDFSAVKAALDALKEAGVADLRAYVSEHPEFVTEAIDMVRIVDVNEWTLQMFGAEDKHVLLESLHQIFVPETRPVFVEELVAIFEGRTSLQAETRLRTLRGEPVDVLVSLAFPEDELRSVLVTLVDITELKRAEESLKEADRRKDDFLAMLGHELRNPLAAIRNAAELMQLSLTEDSPMAAVSGVLDRQSAHMARLVDGLLDISRITRGKISLDRELLDLHDVVTEVMQDRRHSLEEGGLVLELDEWPDLPVRVWADRVRIAQVFDNLIGNAIKFTGSPGTIGVAMRSDGRETTVTVRDSGAGIRPDLLPVIFEPFQQELQDRGRSSGGLGLGLALVRGIVELHGGEVVARSDGPGRGAEFEVRLPNAARPDTPEELQPEPETPLPRRILVVEDHEDAGSLLGELLVVQGHEVVGIAREGREALERLREVGAEVVLCDIGLPDMSGLDVARAIRQDPSMRDVSLVALTGYGQSEDRRRSREAGFDEHLTKPVSSEALRDVLARLGTSPG